MAITISAQVYPRSNRESRRRNGPRLKMAASPQATVTRSLALLLYHPVDGGRPSLRMRLVVAVPVARDARRIQIVAPLHEGQVPVAEEHVIPLPVRRSRFGMDNRAGSVVQMILIFPR